MSGNNHGLDHTSKNKLCRPPLWGQSGFAGVEIYATSMLAGARTGTPEEIWGPRKDMKCKEENAHDEQKQD